MQSDGTFQKIWQQLSGAPAPEEEQIMRGQITRRVLSVTLLTMFFFAVIVVFGWARGVFDTISLWLTAGLLLSVAMAAWLANNGHWEKASLVPPLAFFLVGVSGTYRSGLITDTNLLYAVAILLAAMVRSGREQWLLFGLSVFTQAVLGWARDPAPVEMKISSTLTVSGSLLGITTLQWFFSRQLRLALVSSRAYAAVLKEYRNHLEELVVQRTAELGRANDELQSEIQEKIETDNALQAAHDALESRVDERTAELSIMLEAARAISSTLDLDSILRVIAKQMVIAVNANTCLVYRYDEPLEQIEQWAIWSRDEQSPSLGPPAAIDLGGLPQIKTVLKELEPATLRLEGTAAVPEAALLPAAIAGGSLLTLPLVGGRRPIGFVVLVSIDQERQYSSNEIQFCQALADQAAVTIDNARLHAETQKRSERLAALHSIDMAITSSLDLKFTVNVLLEQLVNQLHVDAALLSLNRQQRLRYLTGRGFRTNEIERTHLKVGEGLAGRAALDRRLLHVADLRETRIGDGRADYFQEEGFITGFAVPLIARGDLQGVLEIFYRRTFTPDAEWQDFVETIGGQAAIAVHNTERLDKLEETKSELEVAYNNTLKAWATGIYERLAEAPNEIDRLVDWTVSLAQALQIHPAEIGQLARGALLHDIGMLKVPEAFVRKPGPLKSAERLQIEQHPTLAFEMLSNVAYLKPSMDIPYCHHERWDGSGYPLGLKAEEIPLAARLFSPVDVWHALTSPRPYRPAWPNEEARDFIMHHRGKLFDPEIVDVLDQIVMSVEDISNTTIEPNYAPASERTSS